MPLRFLSANKLKNRRTKNQPPGATIILPRHRKTVADWRGTSRPRGSKKQEQAPDRKKKTRGVRLNSSGALRARNTGRIAESVSCWMESSSCGCREEHIVGNQGKKASPRVGGGRTGWKSRRRGAQRSRWRKSGRGANSFRGEEKEREGETLPRSSWQRERGGQAGGWKEARMRREWGWNRDWLFASVKLSSTLPPTHVVRTFAPRVLRADGRFPISQVEEGATGDPGRSRPVLVPGVPSEQREVRLGSRWQSDASSVLHRPKRF